MEGRRGRVEAGPKDPRIGQKRFLSVVVFCWLPAPARSSAAARPSYLIGLPSLGPLRYVLGCVLSFAVQSRSSRSRPVLARPPTGWPLGVTVPSFSLFVRYTKKRMGAPFLCFVECVCV